MLRLKVSLDPWPGSSRESPGTGLRWPSLLAPTVVKPKFLGPMHKSQTSCASSLEQRKVYLLQGQARRREWQPAPMGSEELPELPEEFHGQRSLSDYSPWDCKESNMAEQLTLLMRGERGDLHPKDEFQRRHFLLINLCIYFHFWLRWVLVVHMGFL